MSRPAFEVRPADPEDRPGLEALFADRFGHHPTESVWTWKYDRIPGASQSVVAVATSGRIVAHAGALALPARAASQVAPVWQLVDFMATTAGGGLRSAMVGAGRFLLRSIPRPGDLPCVFGFPSQRHFRLGERVFGYRVLPAVPVLEGLLPRTAAATGAVEVSDHCGDWVEAAIAASDARGVVRSTSFLNWRYHARPGRYYRFYRLGRSQGCDGLAVFGFTSDVAQAAELWLPAGGSFRSALLEVARDLRELDMERWQFWPPSGAQARAELAELGVHPSGTCQFMGVVGREGGPDPVAAATELEFFMGDYDAV